DCSDAAGVALNALYLHARTQFHAMGSVLGLIERRNSFAGDTPQHPRHCLKQHHMLLKLSHDRRSFETNVAAAHDNDPLSRLQTAFDLQNASASANNMDA